MGNKSDKPAHNTAAGNATSPSSTSGGGGGGGDWGYIPFADTVDGWPRAWRAVAAECRAFPDVVHVDWWHEFRFAAGGAHHQRAKVVLSPHEYVLICVPDAVCGIPHRNDTRDRLPHNFTLTAPPPPHAHAGTATTMRTPPTVVPQTTPDLLEQAKAGGWQRNAKGHVEWVPVLMYPPHNLRVELYTNRPPASSTATVAGVARPSGDRTFVLDESRSREYCDFEFGLYKSWTPNLFVTRRTAAVAASAADAAGGGSAVEEWWCIGKSDVRLNAKAMVPVLTADAYETGCGWPRELAWMIGEYADGSMSQWFTPGREFALAHGHVAHLKFASEPQTFLSLHMQGLKDPHAATAAASSSAAAGARPTTAVAPLPSSSPRTGPCDVVLRCGESTRILAGGKGEDSFRFWPAMETSSATFPADEFEWEYVLTLPGGSRFTADPFACVRVRVDVIPNRFWVGQPVYLFGQQWKVCVLAPNPNPSPNALALDQLLHSDAKASAASDSAASARFARNASAPSDTGATAAASAVSSDHSNAVIADFVALGKLPPRALGGAEPGTRVSATGATVSVADLPDAERQFGTLQVRYAGQIRGYPGRDTTGDSGIYECVRVFYCPPDTDLKRSTVEAARAAAARAGTSVAHPFPDAVPGPDSDAQLQLLRAHRMPPVNGEAGADSWGWMMPPHYDAQPRYHVPQYAQYATLQFRAGAPHQPGPYAAPAGTSVASAFDVVPLPFENGRWGVQVAYVTRPDTARNSLSSTAWGKFVALRVWDMATARAVSARLGHPPVRGAAADVTATAASAAGDGKEVADARIARGMSPFLPGIAPHPALAHGASAKNADPTTPTTAATPLASAETVSWNAHRPAAVPNGHRYVVTPMNRVYPMSVTPRTAAEVIHGYTRADTALASLKPGSTDKPVSVNPSGTHAGLATLLAHRIQPMGAAYPPYTWEATAGTSKTPEHSDAPRDGAYAFHPLSVKARNQGGGPGQYQAHAPFEPVAAVGAVSVAPHHESTAAGSSAPPLPKVIAKPYPTGGAGVRRVPSKKGLDDLADDEPTGDKLKSFA